MSKIIDGFSKLTKEEKIDWLTSNFFSDKQKALQTLKQYWSSSEKLQSLHDDFIENTISNYYLPYGIAPNFIINDKEYVIPMVVEESSIVAAASMAAKFWSKRGGFKSKVISTVKVGQVHFIYKGKKEELEAYFQKKKLHLFEVTKSITKNMRKRGGGILDINLRDKTKELENYYQLHITFETKDSMGANFINSCLEAIANTFENESITLIMSILSNYVPDCLVRAQVSCPVDKLHKTDGLKFANRFKQAVEIAKVEPFRATTHNKGIMNGIDAVALATGNDFRAIEAGAHTYASKDGIYRSLSDCAIEDGVFHFWLEIPIALGTVGGLTDLHPLVKLSLDMLGRPGARELMQIIAVVGLAQNFGALKALTTTGIQKGHMKMHLTNILKQLQVTPFEREKIIEYFGDKVVSHKSVVEQINKLRN